MRDANKGLKDKTSEILQFTLQTTLLLNERYLYSRHRELPWLWERQTSSSSVPELLFTNQSGIQAGGEGD